jgi:hypothetical protein
VLSSTILFVVNDFTVPNDLLTDVSAVAVAAITSPAARPNNGLTPSTVNISPSNVPLLICISDLKSKVS